MPHTPATRRSALGRLLPVFALGAALLVAPTAPAQAADPVTSGPRVVAASGTEGIDAFDPSSRTAGILALYGPNFGPSTKTNAFGAEAILEPTEERGVYEVTYSCMVATAGCIKPGDNAIPADGYVLSASAGGTPDVRTFIRDHVKAGTKVRLLDLKVRTVTATVDVVDPTTQNNPPGVDPAKGECYPGCRGAEQLIVYTPAHGAKTGTNDFGYEVTVVEGRVASRGGNNRDIPANGFVVSGHGSRGSWLSSNALLGAQVSLTGTTLTVTIDAQTYIYNAEQAIQRARDGVEEAKRLVVAADFATAATRIGEAQELLGQARAAADAQDVDNAVALAEQAQQAATLAWYATSESRPVEGRGIWVRPTETTLEQIRVTLDKVKAAGLNMVYLETVWQGYTIFPSDAAASYGIAKQRPNMVGIDALKLWTDEAHARGIELHAWVEAFFVGAQSEGGVGPVLTAHPEWAAVEREDVGKLGPQPSSQEPGYYFIDAAIPQARQYVTDVWTEILTEYDVDGLHLDYIRYPVSQPWQTAGYSYSDHSRAAFAAEAGVDPYTLTPESPKWTTWNAWRERNITTFVGAIRGMQQRVAPDVQVSAAVFPDPADGLVKKFQNWADWADKQYVDFLTGMSFGTSGASVAADTTLMRNRVGDLTLLYTATYGPFRGSTPDVLVDQTQAVRDAGSDGAGVFAYNQLSAPQGEALGLGVFRTPAITPHADPRRAALTAAASTSERLDAARKVSAVPAVDVVRTKAALAAAQALLRAGQVERAVQAYGRALVQVQGWDQRVDPQLKARFVRDLTMQRRWLVDSLA